MLGSTSSCIVESAKEISSPTDTEVDSAREFLQALANILQEHEVPPFSFVRELFEALIGVYVLAGAPEYPKRLPGWAYKPKGCGKANCEDCKGLNRFLGAADEIEGRFSMNEKRRKHLEYSLPMRPDFLRCTTDKRKMPYTLVITKVGEGKEFEEDLKSYQRSLDITRESTLPLRHDYVKRLLGESRYRELVLLETPEDSEGGIQLAERGKRKAADDFARDSNPDRRPRKS